jgi:AhpD family alkylhydroperoxidase
MTWLPEHADGGTPLDRVLGLRPDLAGPYREFIDIFWRDRLVDPVVLDLCRLRVAQLLGCLAELGMRTPEAVAAGLTEEQATRVAAWPTAECFTDSQRAALAFAEQFVIDPHGIAGPIRDDLREHYPLPEVVALTEALALFDGFQRLQLVLGDD